MGRKLLFQNYKMSQIISAEIFGIQVYIIGDTCWGSCDLNTHAPEMLAPIFCSILAIPLRWILLVRRS